MEIFQWKGQLETHPGGDHISLEETTHIGEEIADVFIYSTRLSDICNIDLAQAVAFALSQVQGEHKCSRPNQAAWLELPLDTLLNSAADVRGAYRSQRHICFALQAAVGRLCEVFSRNAETECTVGLPHWSNADIEEMSTHLGSIGVLLACMASASGVSLSQCITDKFAKNARKYPADKARGSSAKYTEYAESTSEPQST